MFSLRKLIGTESDMELKEWERRHSEFALCESQCELQFERHQLRQANQWADQTQRERINFGGEIGDEESTASRKATQEVAKKLKNYEDVAFKKKTNEPITDWTNIICSRKGVRICRVNSRLESENCRTK